MKRRLLFVLFCLPFLSTFAENIPTLLMIWSKDGTKQAYALSEKPNLTLSDNKLIITTSTLTADHELNSLARFTYEQSDETDLSNLLTDGKGYQLDQESICFPHLDANSKINIYRTDGSIVLKKEIKESGSYAFPLSGLPSGVYILQVNGSTSKIMKP